MTKTNHRLQTLTPSRRTPAAYQDHDLRAMAYFDFAFHKKAETFGKRCADPQNVACAANCGHPACGHGCTLVGRNGW